MVPAVVAILPLIPCTDLRCGTNYLLRDYSSARRGFEQSSVIYRWSPFGNDSDLYATSNLRESMLVYHRNLKDQSGYSSECCNVYGMYAV